MMEKLLKIYREDKTNENLEKLEKVTKKLSSTVVPPEFPVMNVLLSLSENGVVGLDKDGHILFCNYSMTNFLSEEKVKGKKIYDIIKGEFSDKLKEFIESSPDINSIKIEIESAHISRVYNIIAYRVKDISVYYILFFIDCAKQIAIKIQL